MIRVFLVEDEPPALRKLERMVAVESDLLLCGTAGTCCEAISLISETRPSLLILDVKLPDGTGFEILQAIEARSLNVIFVTAYDQYALNAFDVAALDYLVKPVGQDRFAQAIDRVRSRLQQPENQPPAKYAKRFLVERRKAAYLLPVEQIEAIEADRNYALLHSELGEFTLRTTMDALQQQLDPSDFARVSRSEIIRVAAIQELRPRGDGSYLAILLSGMQVPCSRKYWTLALDRFL